MKMVYLILVIIIAAVAVYKFSKNKRNTTAYASTNSNEHQKDTSHHDKDNPYEGLRSLALSLTSEQLQITLPNDETRVYGIVMDWDLSEGCATITAFTTGDASFYLSSGGGMIGSGQHENVAVAAKAFVRKAQTYLNKTQRTETIPLPDKNCVRFYLLTNKGKFTVQEQIQNFENNSSIWLPLFEEGNKVISEMRMHYNEGQDGQPVEQD